MKLEIMGKSFAEAEVSLTDFKKDLSKDFNLRNAIIDNTKILRCDSTDINVDSLKTLVWGSMDWAGIIDELSERHEDSMKVKFFVVKYSDWNKLYPGNMDDKNIEFIEEKESNYATLMVQSFVKNPNFDIKAFLKQGCYLYASTDNKKFAWSLR